jgi:ribonuclease HI
MQPDPNAVQIYVDGSSFVRQGRRSGYAGYVVYTDGSASAEPIVFRGFEESSIQRMELAGVVAAMEWVIEELRPLPTRVQIFSDSQTTLDLIAAAPYLQKRRWKNSQGRAIEHEDLWRKFQSVRNKIRTPIHFGKVLGKSTPFLKLVDRAAKRAALSGTIVDRGYRPGKVGRPTASGGSAKLFPAGGQQVAIRIYGSKLVGKQGENRFKFQRYDQSTGESGSKFTADTSPELGAMLHRGHTYRVQMNDNPRYPQIVALLEEILLPKAAKKPRSVATPAPSELARE